MKATYLAKIALVFSAFFALTQLEALAQKKPAPKPAKSVKKAAVAPLPPLDRSKKPAPGPAPKINLANAEQWTLNNGLKVFFVRDTKLPRITYQLQLDYDPILEGPVKGYVAIAGDLLSNGTQALTKDQLDEEIDYMGAALGSSASGASAFGLSRYAQRLLEIMGDVVTKPRMDVKDFELIRKRSLSALAASKNDPRTISRRVSDRLTYGTNHPYGEFSTEETLKKITLEKCKEFYTTYFRPNVGYLAIVGDITSEQAHAWTQQYLGPWQQATVPAAAYKLPAPLVANEIVVVDKASSVQTVINICAPVDYTLSDTAYIKARVMNDILGGNSSSRLFNNLRERHGFTYGAYSSLNPNKYVGSFSANASVRTAVTDSSVQEFRMEMRRIGTEAVSDSELTLTKNGLAGSFINSLESPQTVANFAINTKRYNLAPEFYQTYLAKLAAITKEDVMRQAGRFVKDVGNYIVIVGNAKEIIPKLEAFGKVRLLDEYGNAVNPNPLRVAPAGLTAETVVSQYIQAIGGAEAIKKLKDLSLTYTGEVQGQTLVLDQYRKRPNMQASVVSIAMNEVDRTTCNGKTSIKKGQMGTTEASGKDLENAIARAVFFPEINYAAIGVKSQLLGLEKVNGQDANKLEFTFLSGDSWIDYFDAVTHLRVRRTESRQTPRGPLTISTDYADYKAADGTTVKVPGTFTLPLGPMTIKVTLTSAKANTGLKNSVFEPSK